MSNNKDKPATAAVLQTLFERRYALGKAAGLRDAATKARLAATAPLQTDTNVTRALLDLAEQLLDDATQIITLLEQTRPG